MKSFLPGFSVFILIIFRVFSITTSAQSFSEQDRMIIPVEDLRIIDTDEFYFVNIADLVVGNEGEIYLYDQGVPALYWFDSNGTFLGEIGREGRGPGEFLRLRGLSVLPDGRLTAHDFDNGRINIYSVDGEIDSTILITLGLFDQHTFETDFEGNFYIKSVQFPNGIPKSSSDWHFQWNKLSQKGNQLATISIPLNSGVDECHVIYSASGPMYNFCEQTLSRLTRNGDMITGKNDDYDFQIWQVDDSLSIHRAYEPIEITEEEKTYWKSKSRRSNNLPRFKPPYKEIFSSADGRIWIHRYVKGEYSEAGFYGKGGWYEPAVYDIFLRDGAYYRTIKFPHGFHLLEAIDNTVYGILTDEYLEESVVRYKLFSE